MKEISPELGAYEHNKTTEHADSKFASLLSRGGITCPTKKFLKDVKIMQKMFKAFHPKNDLNRGPGLIQNFYNHLRQKFKVYEDKVLHLVARCFTRFRMKTINRQAYEAKLKRRKRSKRGPKSL